MSEICVNLVFLLPLLMLLLLSAHDVKAQRMPQEGSMQDQRRIEQFVRKTKAEQMLAFMNQTADPCEDFYEFVCGNWTSDKSQPGEVVTLQTQLEDKIYAELQQLLEQPKTSKDTLAMLKIKSFYQSCTTVERTSHNQQNFIKNFLSKFNGLPAVAGTGWNAQHYNWLSVVALLKGIYGLDILIDVGLGKNEHGSGQSIYLSEPKTTLMPPELCGAIVQEQLNVKDEAYELLQKEMANNMKSWFSLRDSETNRFAGDIIRFEFELCKQMRKEQSMQQQASIEEQTPFAQHNSFNSNQRYNKPRGYQGTNQPNRKSLLDWTKHFEDIIDFTFYVDKVFARSISDDVYLVSEPYFRHLTKTIRNTEKQTLANYIMYRVLVELNFPKGDCAASRPQYCVNQVLRYFPQHMGEMYRDRHARNDVSDDVEDIYKDVRKAFKKSLRAQDWMHKEHHNAAEQKLSTFQLRFPIHQNLGLEQLIIDNMDYWHKLDAVMKHSANEKLWSMVDGQQLFLSRLQSYDISAQLQHVESEVILKTAWGLLQSPFYDYNYGHSLKFSTIGQQLAKEIVKGFDELGWHQNHLIKWDELTMYGYRNRSQCHRTQYSNYLHNNPEQFRNATRLREIITHASGLNIAFQAYLSWLNLLPPKTNVAVLKKETLPDLNFSNTQLFFIHFAQAHCNRKNTHQTTPQFMPLGKHTPERFEVNGPLMNFEEFGREFGCRIGTEMNPDEKCVLYA